MAWELGTSIGDIAHKSQARSQQNWDWATTSTKIGRVAPSSDRTLGTYGEDVAKGVMCVLGVDYYDDDNICW